MNATNRHGTTALHWAVDARIHQEPILDTVSALLIAGADVLIRQRDGSSPLHWGIRRLSVTKLLVEARADLDMVNEDGDSPLALAAKGGEYVGKHVAEFLQAAKHSRNIEHNEALAQHRITRANIERID